MGTRELQNYLHLPELGRWGRKEKQCRGCGIEGLGSLGCKKPEPGEEWGVPTMNPSFGSWTFSHFILDWSHLQNEENMPT